jgi:hypothetical protein
MLPFTALGVAAIVAGGIVAARTAAHPVPVLVWMVAYLVLVAGVAQYTLGVGQARLASRIPSPLFIALEWLAFNLGNAAVIAGTLIGATWWVIGGSILFALAVLAFAWGTAASPRRIFWLAAYLALIALLVASAIVGVIFTLAAPP